MPAGSEGEGQSRATRLFFKTIYHFFGNIFERLANKIHDPRNPDLIIYPLPCLVFVGILLFACRLGARRQVHWALRNSTTARKCLDLFGIESSPHGDTLNYLFSRMDAEQLGEFLTWLCERLIRKKVLYPFRLLDRFFLIVIDGTRQLSFDSPHCKKCLTQKSGDKIQYFHPVLEAKLIAGNGFAFSLMTEFIENPDGKYVKQDCELKAFYRLADRLKERFPRLPICLVADGLYAGGPFFSICEKNGWKFLVTLKDQDLPFVNSEFEALWPLQSDNKANVVTGKQSNINQRFRWANGIQYVDTITPKHTHLLSVLECGETEGERSTKFKWVTNFEVTKKNYFELSNYGGRSRWKIENEGFNVQKNGGFGLEHAYSENLGATKAFYYLLQIAHIFVQLVEKGNAFTKVFPKGLGSSKNLAKLLEKEWTCFPCQPLGVAALSHHFQVRFNSS